MPFLGSYISGGSALSFTNASSRRFYDRHIRTAAPSTTTTTTAARKPAGAPTKRRTTTTTTTTKKPAGAATKRPAATPSPPAKRPAATPSPPAKRPAATPSPTTSGRIAKRRCPTTTTTVARPRSSQHMAQLAAEAAARTGARDARATRKA